MKKNADVLNLILTFSVLLLLSLTVHASGQPSSQNQNPQMRICRVLGGQFFTAQNKSQDFGFCGIGSSIIETTTLLQWNRLEKNILPQATAAYLNEITDCTTANGVLESLSVTSPGNLTYEVCRFNDESMIERQTFELGKNSPENSLLNEALFGVSE